MVVVILRNKTEIKRLQSTMWATLCVPSLGAMDFERIEEVSHLKKKEKPLWWGLLQNNLVLTTTLVI